MRKKIDVSNKNWRKLISIKKQNMLKWNNDVITELLNLYENNHILEL